MDNGLVPIRQVAMGAAAVVLILIVVDNGLVLRSCNAGWQSHAVLILIVVDNGLVQPIDKLSNGRMIMS